MSLQIEFWVRWDRTWQLSFIFNSYSLCEVISWIADFIFASFIWSDFSNGIKFEIEIPSANTSWWSFKGFCFHRYFAVFEFFLFLHDKFSDVYVVWQIENGLVIECLCIYVSAIFNQKFDCFLLEIKGFFFSLILKITREKKLNIFNRL